MYVEARSQYWETFLLNLELMDSAKLAGQKAPGFHLSLSLRCRDYSYVPLHGRVFEELSKLD